MFGNFRGVKLGVHGSAILVCAPFLFLLMEICLGYVMPAEQLIQFMAKNFSKFETLVITQTTLQQDPKDEEWEESFTEKIWMKSPDFFRSKILNEKSYRVLVLDTDYRQLLVTHSKQTLMELLIRMGVNLESVGFTRIEEVTAYRIGDQGPDNPKLLIEKERFLPLLLKYVPPRASKMETITVRFKEYRKLDQGWYPFEMTYSVNDEIREVHTIHTIDANVPIDPALLDIPETEPPPGPAPEKEMTTPEKEMTPQEEERLRKIIKTFEEKYQ